MRGHVRKYLLKDGETRWAAVVYRGKRVAENGCLQDSYRWIRGFATQKAADAELNKVLHSMTNGTYLEPTKQTLAEYLERWLATIKCNLAPKSFERYEQIVRVNINPRLGPIRLIELQPMQIAQFYTWSTMHGNMRFKTGLNTRTVLHIHRLLRKALKQAVRWGLRMKNPTDDVDAPSPEDRETKPLEEEGAAQLIVASEETRLFLSDPRRPLHGPAPRRNARPALE